MSVRNLAYLIILSMLASTPVASQEIFTPEQRETLCHSFADISVATIEAREAGVPIERVLQMVRDLPLLGMPSDRVGRWFQERIREGVIATYAQPPIGERPTVRERQQLINRFTAECLLDSEGDDTAVSDVDRTDR